MRNGKRTIGKNSLLGFLMLSLLRGYKRFISPLLIPACRFTPTCSEYAFEAISRYGAGRGVWMTLKRLLRCNPFCKGGFDPIR